MERRGAEQRVERAEQTGGWRAGGSVAEGGDAEKALLDGHSFGGSASLAPTATQATSTSPLRARPRLHSWRDSAVARRQSKYLGDRWGGTGSRPYPLAQLDDGNRGEGIRSTGSDNREGRFAGKISPACSTCSGKEMAERRRRGAEAASARCVTC